MKILLLLSATITFAICNLQLTTTENGPQPFTVGQPFAKGDVPFGTEITAAGIPFQADVRNRWSDGSVRFAVISGIAPAGTITINAGGTPYTGTAVAEPVVGAVVSFTSVVDASGTSVESGTFSAALSTARTAGTGTWSRTAARKVREITGPVMSEFHYYVPTADAHTCVWFFVRAYSTGQIEVETIVENGWLQVASPGRRNYNVTVTIGDSLRYTGSNIVHYHHTRWGRIDWIRTDPKITPKHDVAYLQKINGFPALAVSSLNSAAYTGCPESGTKYSSWTRDLAEKPTPFAIGNVDPALGAGGYSDNPNLFGPWDMTYLVEGDGRAYWAIQGNMRAAGRFSLHYRDEATGGVARGSQYPTLGLNDASVGISDNSGNAPILTPAPNGGVATPGWTYSHGPSLGFMAYLTTGRWSAWETTQFLSATADFTQSGNMYQGFRIGPWWEQLRSHGWKFRFKAQAAVAAPAYLNGTAVTGNDADQRTEALGRLNSDAGYYHAAYVADSGVNATPRQVANNVFGLWYQNQDYDERNDSLYTVGGMMQGYNCMAVMWAYEAEASSDMRLKELAAFSARFPVGMLGGAPNGTKWDYRLFTFYQAPFGTGGMNAAKELGAVKLFPTWDSAWSFMSTTLQWGPSNPFPLPNDKYLRNMYPYAQDDKKYQIGNPQIQLSLASSNAVSSAATVAIAYDLAASVTLPGVNTMAANFYNSDTWKNTIVGDFKNNPQYAYAPKRLLPLAVVFQQSNIKSANLSVFPNPCRIGGNVNLVSDNSDFVSVYNIAGRVIKIFNANERSWNTAGLTTGLYIIKIKTGSKTITHKILIGQ